MVCLLTATNEAGGAGDAPSVAALLTAQFWPHDPSAFADDGSHAMMVQICFRHGSDMMMARLRSETARSSAPTDAPSVSSMLHFLSQAGCEGDAHEDGGPRFQRATYALENHPSFKAPCGA